MESFFKKLEKYGQQPLIEYLQSLDAEKQECICRQFEEIGVDKIFSDFSAAMAYDKSLSAGTNDTEILPPGLLSYDKLASGFAQPGALPAQVLRLADLNESQQQELHAIGVEAISTGKVAIVILAGGQGSRLGYAGPKGNYQLDLPSQSTIYKILMTRIKALSNLVGMKHSTVPVYIMTSEQNDRETQQHFLDNDYFGLNKDCVKFFVQTVMPSFDKETGSVLFASETEITRNPNGNGGVFASLVDRGMLADMQNRGIKYLHVHGIDNVVVKSADPLFMGACIKAKVPTGNKCCAKRDPHEKVGVQVNKKQGDRLYPSVVEYTEISKQQAEARHPDGQLVYSAANIVNHFFTLESLTAADLQYHVAVKKIPYFDLITKSVVQPTEPNGIKLEYFIFDAFENASSVLVFECNRADEFSPVKNADGSDSPATAKEDLGKLHCRYLMAAGLVSQAGLYEISPGSTFAGENLDQTTEFTAF